MKNEKRKENGTKRIFLVSTFFILFLFSPSVTNNQEVRRNSKTNVSSRIFFEIDGASAIWEDKQKGWH
jgi:hypothetical protein